MAVVLGLTGATLELLRNQHLPLIGIVLGAAIGLLLACWKGLYSL
jgi:hypothetical protein